MKVVTSIKSIIGESLSRLEAVTLGRLGMAYYLLKALILKRNALGRMKIPGTRITVYIVRDSTTTLVEKAFGLIGPDSTTEDLTEARAIIDTLKHDELHRDYITGLEPVAAQHLDAVHRNHSLINNQQGASNAK